MFTPDVEKLLKRFEITKPVEQFEVGPVPPNPDIVPEPLNKTDFDTPTLPLVVRLEDEATKVQDILDIINDTAEEISVPVPPEESGFLGQTITTKDYIRSLEATDEEDPLRLKKQQTFEHGVLSNYGYDPHWTLLMSSDLIDIRNTLLSSKDMIEGRLLADQEIAAASGGNKWKDSVLNSDLIHVHEQMILASEQVRFKVAQTVFTLNISLPASDLDSLLSLAVDPAVAAIKPALNEILSFLRNARSILIHSQLLLAFEYKRTREAIINIIESAIIDRMLNILVVKLSDLVNQVASPVLDSMENIFGNGPIEKILNKEVSQQFVSVLGGTIQAIVLQYKGIAADILREHSQKTGMQLGKLQALGERNIVGRWVVHIDQVITIVEKALNEVNLSKELAAQVIKRAVHPPSPPDLPILKRFLDHPELSQAKDLDMRVRSLGITPQLAGPPAVPFYGLDAPPQPQFGIGDVNPQSLNNQ